MSEIKSLADQLRHSIAATEKSPDDLLAKKVREKTKSLPADHVPDLNPEILQAIHSYDTSAHKTMVHARFDAKTAKMLGHFKMATGVENTRIAAFAVHYLFETHPELKSIIKHYIQNLEL